MSELYRVKKFISGYMGDGKDKVENYLQELRVEQEELENLKSENIRFCRIIMW